VTESAEGGTARAVRRISLAALACWGVLVALQIGWIPFARYAWAFNLWSYFPSWVGITLGGAALLLCFGPMRAAIASGGARIGDEAARLPRVPALLAALLGLAVLAWLLWLLRERYVAGDSALLVLALSMGDGCSSSRSPGPASCFITRWRRRARLTSVRSTEYAC